MTAEPRLLSQPLRQPVPPSASPISISSDEDGPLHNKFNPGPAVMNPWERTVFGDLLSAAPAPPPPVPPSQASQPPSFAPGSQQPQLPSFTPVSQYPQPPSFAPSLPAPPSQQTTETPEPKPSHKGQLSSDPGPVHPQVMRNFIADTMSCALEYMQECRNNKALTIDPHMLKMLQDPMPGVKKPHTVLTVDDVTDDLWRYFTILMLHTNKIFSIAHLWYDLIKYKKIYISLDAICKIQARIFFNSFDVFGYAKTKRLEQQTDHVQLYTLGMMSSIIYLETWAKSADGIYDLQLLSNKSGLDLVKELPCVDELCKTVNRKKWLPFPELEDGRWLYYVNQRFQ